MNQEPRTPNLILASGSAARRSLIRRLGLPVTCSAPNIDETPGAGETAAALVQRLSHAKARALADAHPAALIIGSDQVALHRGQVSGKPLTGSGARALLRRFSGEPVDFLTGLAVLNPTAAYAGYHCDRTRVRFRSLTEGEIERYVARDRPLQCAGGFRLESLGPALFRSIETEDPTALLGLPLIALCRLLREAGLALP